MLAAPAGDLHVVALRMVGNLLREAGYDVLMLGADVPVAALASAVSRHRPCVVCMSSTMPSGIDTVMSSVETVHRVAPDVGFVLGGRGLSGQLEARPFVKLCSRVSEVVEAVDATIKRSRFN